MSMALSLPMDSELIFKATSCGLVGLLWVTTLGLLWISLRKKRSYRQRLRGVIGLTVAVLCLCAFILLVAVYIQETRLQKISHRIETVTSNQELRALRVPGSPDVQPVPVAS